MFCASRLGTECDGCSRCHPSLPLLIPESDVTAERNSEKQKKIMRLSQRSGGINPPTRSYIRSPRQMPVSSCIVGNQLVTTATQIDGNESNAVYVHTLQGRRAAGRPRASANFATSSSKPWRWLFVASSSPLPAAPKGVTVRPSPSPARTQPSSRCRRRQPTAHGHCSSGRAARRGEAERSE